MNCIQRNGDITSYSVRYGVQGSKSTHTTSVSGRATAEATIFELNAATTYLVEVAAVTSVGPGEYSIPITASTLCKQFTQLRFYVMIFNKI